MYKKIGIIILSICLISCLFACKAEENKEDFVNIDKMFNLPDAEISNKLLIKVNNENVDVVNFYSIDYVRFITQGKTKIEITNDVEIKNVDIYPKRKNIEYKISDNQISLKCAKAEDLLIKINDNNWLIILADQKNLSEIKDDLKTKNIEDYLGDYNIEDDLTVKINKALESFKTDIHTTLYFPAKLYNVSSINIIGLENKIVYFEPGAIFRAVVDNPYQTSKPIGFNIDNCKNTVLDGSLFWDNGGNRVRESASAQVVGQNSLIIRGCDDITIKGITVFNGFGWQITGWNNNGLNLLGCRTLTPKENQKEWTDGINVSTTKKLLIDNCIGIANDDCFASGHYPWNNGRFDNEDAIVRNYTSVTYNGYANSARFGWDCYNDLKNFTFEGCEFLGSPRQAFYLNGTKLTNVSGVTGNINYCNFIIKDCKFDVDAGRDYFIFTESDINMDLLKIVNVDVKFFAKSQISGNIKKVYIENLFIAGTKITKANYGDYFVFDGIENENFELVIV